MFWVWIVLLWLYGACCGSMFVLFVTGEIEVSSDVSEIAIAILAVIFSPIIMIAALIGAPIANSIEDHCGLPWIIWVKIRKPIMWIYKKTIMWLWNNTVMLIQKRKDHKEMDDKEDEWKIERLGIKSK